MTKFIGLAGKMGSGKSTFADIMVNNGLAHEQMALATGVKKFAKDIFDKGDRDIWQWMGNTMRQYDSGVWINYLKRQLRWSYITGDPNFIVVVSDIRYRNEAEWIINQGPLIFIDTQDGRRRVRIENRNKEIIAHDRWLKQQQHPSETELDYIKELSNVYIFDNNDYLSYDDLANKFIKWYQETVK